MDAVLAAAERLRTGWRPIGGPTRDEDVGTLVRHVLAAGRAPAAGGPRAGERRALVDPRDANFADVFEWQQMSWGELVDYRLYDGIPIADARLLCSGGELARLRAENAKLRAALELVCEEATNYVGIGWDHGDESAALTEAVALARAALGLAPREGGK